MIYGYGYVGNCDKPIKTKMPTSAVHKKLLTKFLNEFGKKDSGANYSGTSNYKV